MKSAWWLLVAGGAAACGGSTAAAGDGGAQIGPDGGSTSNVPIGAACTPSPELSPTFAGFFAQEVSLDLSHPACGGAVCLANHFQGRTTCPYGQDSAGHSPSPSLPGCTVPGTGQPVVPADPTAGQTVRPQCVDRRPSGSVYCSCRCANAQGKTDDGAAYCACPGSFTCTQLVSEIKPGDPNAGAYCIEDNTVFDRSSSCTQVCDAVQNDCP